MKSLKNAISASLAGFIVLSFCVSCNSDAIYEKEQYKNVIYLLSGSQNVYTESYSLNEEEPVKYFSVGCGGSNTNEKEIVVTIVPDEVLLEAYNKNNFDNVNSYAKILSPSRYTIDSYTVTIPANNPEQYVKVPVKVRPLGLSPDSVYFIPLAIKSVSNYEVNEDKYNMLYRVTIENDYARQKVTTYYTKKGTVKNESTNAETILSGAKMVQPLEKDKIRMYTGNNTQGSNASLADIERYSIVVQINANKTISIAPYGTIEVEMLSANGYNVYNPALLQGAKPQRVIYLYYRYRTLNDNGTYSAWMEVKESLTRVEEV